MNICSVVIIMNCFWRIIFQLSWSFVEVPVTIHIFVSLLWIQYCKLSLLWPNGMELNLSVLTDLKLLNKSILWTALAFKLPCRSGKCPGWYKLWHRISSDIFSISGVCLFLTDKKLWLLVVLKSQDGIKVAFL